MQPSSNSIIFRHSLSKALCHNVELVDYFLKKHKLDVKDDWIPTTKLIDCLFHVEEKIGSNTLKQIGSNIAIAALMNMPSNRSFNFFKNTLNDIYESNHQNLKSGFQIKNVNENYIINLSNNPYPLSFNKGLISQFSLSDISLNNVYQIAEQELFIEKVI
ncbi:hypothetical protein [Metabacillus litoralis]|uniref:hypothetical protein n=1 Tax=Metabacillus litoralis TaxID=152268 RepID=UPI00203DA27A|nr:hypothetical protein [Metabacillus litoralis]MCM3163714.1 hypothetical protein [Metabacillus litoralis]